MFWPKDEGMEGGDHDGKGDMDGRQEGMKCDKYDDDDDDDMKGDKMGKICELLSKESLVWYANLLKLNGYICWFLKSYK